MSNNPAPHPWIGKWLVFSAVSLVFCFLNLATFTSLGVVLFTMVGEFHWSMAAAGFSFSLLGIACGLSSLLPALAMRRFGARTTISVGSVLLVLGFYLAARSESLGMFYLAMVLLGTGYSLAGNVPGVALIAAWFEHGSSRTIGYYLMLGALGAAFGPPVVEAIVSGSGGWRGHWMAMAAAAAVIGVLCLLFVRDKARPAETQGVPAGESEGGWTPRQAILTPQFILVSTAMAATMACITTNSSIGFSHLVKFGASPAFAATILGVIAITATLVKGVAGRLCESIPSPRVLAYGLVLQAGGNVLLAYASTPTLQYTAAIVFGMGWGLAYVAGTVVVLDYFGGAVGSRILSVVWMMTTVAAAGPVAAGMIADRYGTFSPIFNVYAVMLIALAVPVYLMREPAAPPAAAQATAA